MASEDFDLWSKLMYEVMPLSLWCEEQPEDMDVYTACNIGDYECVARELKQYGCTKFSQHNQSGWTPLLYACSGEHTDIVRLLLISGVTSKQCSSTGLTPLMVAAKGSSERILDLLLIDNIASLEATDDRGWTALFHAVKMEQEDSVKCLLQHGANVNAIEPLGGHSVLMLAAKSARITLVHKLLQANANHTMVSPHGDTAMSIALKCGNKPVVQLLQPNNRGHPEDLYTLLKSLALEKYWPLFRDNGVDLYVFLTFTEENLKDLGVNLLGPRRKMALAIARWYNEPL